MIATVDVQAVLTDITTSQNNYARHSDLFAFKPLPRIDQVVPHSAGENIVVEFRYVISIIIVIIVMMIVVIVVSTSVLRYNH